MSQFFDSEQPPFGPEDVHEEIVLDYIHRISRALGKNADDTHGIASLDINELYEACGLHGPSAVQLTMLLGELVASQTADGMMEALMKGKVDLEDILVAGKIPWTMLFAVGVALGRSLEKDQGELRRMVEG